MRMIEAYNLELFLIKILPRTKGRLGFILAKNKRLLSVELVEYKEKRREVFAKYGEKTDASFSIKLNSPAYYSFRSEMNEYDNIEVNPNLTKVYEEDLTDTELTGEEIAILLEVL